jgi:Ca-activated chloride channel family protein
MQAFKGLFLAVFIAAGLVTATAQQQGDNQSFRFRSAVELINVTATVTDGSGRFVPGLRKEDFRILEDGVEQTITHFSSERVPVSLGIALDTSSSMNGQKIVAAREALNRFLFDLLDPADEVFLYRFDSLPRLVQEWTTSRERIRSELGRIVPHGETAMYDTVAEAVPLTQSGHHRKKALVIISDGNDTNSHTGILEVKQLIRETEVMVYAIGIDGRSDTFDVIGQPRMPIPLPFPIPGRRLPPTIPPRTPPSTPRAPVRSRDERVNAEALRDMTDESGGRTELVRELRDLDPATRGIADELSKQYYLGYPATGKKDGRWHTIRVELRAHAYRVRARHGYVATP